MAMGLWKPPDELTSPSGPDLGDLQTIRRVLSSTEGPKETVVEHIGAASKVVMFTRHDQGKWPCLQFHR